ncbi:uncharacterized protein ACIBXB_004487 isoform 3-T3 [Morphnus guianensis]
MPDTCARCSLPSPCSDCGVLCTALPRSRQRDGLHAEHRHPLHPPGDRDGGALPDRYRRGWVPLVALGLRHRVPATRVGATLGPGVPSWRLWGAGCGSALLSIPSLLPLPVDPERGAGTGRAPMPEAVGQLRTEAGLLPFPGTPAGTAEPPSPQGSTRAGGEGTGPAAWDGTATEHLGLPLFAGTTERPSPAPAPVEPDTAPTTRSPPGTDPVGNVMVEGATTPQGSPSHSPSSVTVPGSAGGQWGSPSTLPEQSPTGTGLAQRLGGSQGPSSPELWAGEGTGATVPLGDGSPGTHPSIAPATGSPALGMAGTSPFVGGLQRLLSPAGTPQGTWQGLPGPAGGRGFDSHPWHGTDIAWQGPRSAPRPSLPSLGAGGRGGPLASTAQPAVGTGPTSLPATGKGSGLTVPTATASTPGLTSPSPGGALDPTTGELGPRDTEGTPEHSHVPLVQTWRPPPMPGQPPTLVAPGSTVAAQSRVPYASAGSPHIPPSLQPAPTGSSAVPLSPTPQPSPGTSRGVLGLSPALGTPPAGPSPGHWLPHPSSGGDPAKSPHILGGTTVGVGDAMPWAATALLSWQPGSSAPPSAHGPPQQAAASQSASPLGLTTAVGITATAAAAVTTTTTTTAATASPARLRDVGTVTTEPGAAVLQGNTAGLTWGPPTHLPTMVPGPPQQPTDPPGTLSHRGGPGSPPAARDTDTVQPSSSSRGWPDADTPRATLAPATAGRAPRVFIVEDQPPLLRGASAGFGTLCLGMAGGEELQGAISLWESVAVDPPGAGSAGPCCADPRLPSHSIPPPHPLRAGAGHGVRSRPAGPRVPRAPGPAAQLQPDGRAPLHVGARVPAAGGDGDQVGACAALRRAMLPGTGGAGSVTRCGATAVPGCGAGPGGPSRHPWTRRGVSPQGGQRGAGVRRAVRGGAGAGAGAGRAPRRRPGVQRQPARAGGGRCSRPAQRGSGAAAGPLRCALRLPGRLHLRGRGGRERHLHLPLPPRLLQEPRHLHPPSGPRAPLPVPRRQRFLVHGAALRLPGDAAEPAGDGRGGPAQHRPPGCRRRRRRHPTVQGAADGGQGRPDPQQLPAVLPAGRRLGPVLVPLLAALGQLAGQPGLQQLGGAAPLADLGQRLLQLPGGLGHHRQRQAAPGAARPPAVPAQVEGGLSRLCRKVLSLICSVGGGEAEKGGGLGGHSSLPRQHCFAANAQPCAGLPVLINSTGELRHRSILWCPRRSEWFLSLPPHVRSFV